MRILIAGKIHPAGLSLLQAQAGFTIDLVESVATEKYVPQLPHADALLLRTQPLTAIDIATAPNLKIVSRHGVGYDAVDGKALAERKIPLAIVGDVNSRAVAEHTLMLMLATARRTIAHHIAATTGNWNERNRFDSSELDGKSLLIIGFGRIGKRVGELAKAFGMTVRAFDSMLSAEQIKSAGAEPVATLSEGLEKADFVTLHMPGSSGGPAIGAQELMHMKPSAILINAARGGLADEAALDAALRAGKLRAAGLDVLVNEPPDRDHPLLSNPRVTISPHNAGLTEECAKRMAIAAAQNIIDFTYGRLNPALIVNGV